MSDYTQLEQDPLYDTTTGVDMMTRLKMSFAKPEYKKAVLQKKYGADNVGTIEDKSNRNYGQLVVKDGDNILLADEETFSFKDFIDVVGHIPELVGQIAGGVGGLALGNLPGGVTGAATGGVVGEGVRQVIENKLGVPNPEGVDTNELKNAAIRGGVGELGGFALAKGVGKVLAPFNRSMTPESLALKAEAESLNIPYTGGDITKRRGVNIIESTLDKMVGSAGQFQRLRTGQLKRTGEMADGILDSIGGKVDLTEGGLSAKASMDNVTSAFKTKAKRLYDTVDQAGAGVSIETPNLHQAMQLLRSQDSYKTLPGPVRTLLKNIEAKHYTEEMIKGVKIRTAEPQFYRDLRVLRSELGKKGASKKAIDEKAEGAYKLLKSSLEKDFEVWGKNQGGPVLQAMKEADSFYKLGDEVLPAIKDLKGQLGKKIFKTERPEEIVKHIFRPDNFTNIVKTRKLVGEEGFKTLKQAFLTDIFEGAEGKWMTQGNIEVTFPKIAKLEKFFNTYDLKTMRFIFGDETLGKLNQLRRMVKLSNTAQTMAGNPSGTGQIVLAGQMLTGGGFGAMASTSSPAMIAGAMAAPIITPWAIAKGILSKPIKKYITRGVKIPGMVDSALNATGIGGARGLMGHDQTRGMK